MDEKDIIDSQAFRLLNALIAEQIKYIDIDIGAVKWNAGTKATYIDDIVTHAVAEGAPSSMHSLDMTRQQLKAVVQAATDALKAIDTVGVLVSAKLRLLNDYDFTRGNESFQRAVFNEPDNREVDLK